MAHPTDDRNFRLPTSIRPTRYDAHVALDLSARTFEGRETIELVLDVPAREIVLHAVELEVRNVTLERGGESVSGKVRVALASETVVVELEREVPKGPAALRLEWSGKFSPGLRGLYKGGKVAVTQFEAADCRRLFPSFDEPAFKARWAVTLDVPAEATALGNQRVAHEERKGDRRIVRFAETEVLSSYLVAIAVGELASCEEESAAGIPVRTWAVPEKVHLTKFGQDVALNVLPRLQDYFGIPYAFTKVDQVAIPDFEAGAMENAGLITYREVALLVDPKTASLPVQKRVAEVVTHELAHQWFGNWVTMVWWDDLWLNEAFATWMAYKIVDQWRPGWRIWLNFDAGKASALVLDALWSTHPIRGEVHNAAEATESFDAITYEKGGAVLRMIESYLGEETFCDGIRAYMKRHARANAVADDLWRALAEASKEPVVELANAWIRQSGYPLVTVSRTGNTVTLSQRRFFSQPGVRSDETWPVPVILRFRDDAGVHAHRVLFRGTTQKVDLPAAGAIRWVCGNGGATGFYRVAYDDAGLRALAEDLASLEPAERIALLSDRWALVRSGEASIESLLELVFRFGGERDYAVLDELVGRLATIDYRLVSDADLPAFRAVVRSLLQPLLDEVGWDAKADEPGDVRQRRAAIVRAIAVVGRDEGAARELRARIDRVLAGQKDALEAHLHDSAVVAAARAGDAALFDTLLKAFQTEPDPAFKRRYLSGLTAFEAPDLVQRAIDLAFTDTVPLQDFASFVSGLLANPAARAPFWRTLQQRWGAVTEKTSSAPTIFRRVVESIGNLRERAELDEAKKHLAAHPSHIAKQATAQTLERLEQDVGLRERTMPAVTRWLQKGSAD
ncbi:MAG: M1 family metallopeptidase [Myxococcaceae bacterium]|nr:M1 family metallopeptidase [Myxococcaceae bacterium]